MNVRFQLESRLVWEKTIKSFLLREMKGACSIIENSEKKHQIWAYVRSFS